MAAPTVPQRILTEESPPCQVDVQHQTGDAIGMHRVQSVRQIVFIEHSHVLVSAIHGFTQTIHFTYNSTGLNSNLKKVEQI